jgi:hypothetical protein
MRRILLFPLLTAVLCWPACRTVELRTTLFDDIPSNALEPASIPNLSPFRLEKLVLSPEHMIDDFETGPGLWSIQVSKGTRASLADLTSGTRHAAKFSYQLPRRRFRGIDPDQAQIHIVKEEMAFERYNGIQFIARSRNRIPLRVILYEHNTISDRITAQEFWVREVELSPEWKVYRLMFNEFASEEYYEQGYVGNDRMETVRIREVGFCVRNLSTLPEDSGEIDLDDVQLF